MDPIAAVHLAISDPAKGIPILVELLDELNSAADADGAHAVQDTLIVVCSEHRVHLEKAEELAVDLLHRMPDQTHASMLARIYVLMGRLADAAALEESARTMADLHDRTQARSALAQLIAQGKVSQS
jgi:hypothetical protein